MPGNSLTFAIEVSGQVNGFRFSCGLDDVSDVLLAAFVKLVSHLKIVVGIDRTIFGGQIPDMAIGSKNLEVRTQVPVNGAGFGG